MDILAKRTALRTKLIGKFRDPSREVDWRNHFMHWLSSFGLRNEDNLLRAHSPVVFIHLPRFFQEVLNAWFLLFGETSLVCKSRASVLRLPFLSSPYFKQGGGGSLSVWPLRGQGWRGWVTWLTGEEGGTKKEY